MADHLEGRRIISSGTSPLAAANEGQDQNPRVPGPFIRVMAGNEVTIVLENDAGNAETHSIDLHAVVGARGGASLLKVPPGMGDDSIATLTFTPQSPGLYIYHCVGDGSPHGIAHHQNNGMNGLILVEPRSKKRSDDDDDGGSRGSRGSVGQAFKKAIKNATEFYVLEQTIFRENDSLSDLFGDFNEHAMLEGEVPSFVVFNGRIGSLVDRPMAAQVGRNAVIYHGYAGTDSASIHTIGEIYDEVFHDGDILSPPQQNIQTTLIPASGAAVLVMDGDKLVPTDQDLVNLNIHVDHSITRFRKGALGLMVVTDP